jgi:hypothetical protein
LRGQGKALLSGNQRGTVGCGQGQRVVARDHRNVDQGRKLVDGLLALVDEGAGVFSDVLQVGDLPVELGDLRGELVDLADGLLHAGVEAGALCGQLVGRDVEGGGYIAGGGEHALAQR